MSVISLGGGPRQNAVIKPGTYGFAIHDEDGSIIGSGFPTEEEAQRYLDSFNAALIIMAQSHDTPSET